MTDFTALVGQPIALSPALATASPLRRCGCGWLTGELTQGIASHPLSVRCAKCRRHVCRLTGPQVRKWVLGVRG